MYVMYVIRLPVPCTAGINRPGYRHHNTAEIHHLSGG